MFFVGTNDMIDLLETALSPSEPFRRVLRAAAALRPGERRVLSGVSGSLLALLIAGLAKEGERQVLVVSADRDEAEKLRDDCLAAGAGAVGLHLHARHHAGTALDMTAPVMSVEALRMLADGRPAIISASLEAAVGLLPGRSAFLGQCLRLHAGGQFPFQELIGTLTERGFQRKDFVEEYGDFAVRGGILDVFPYTGEHPVRLEFWGDTIESMREFDVRSQRSLRDLDSAIVASNLFESSGPGPQATILDYLSAEALVLLDEPVRLRQEAEELLREGVGNILDPDQFEQQIRNYRTLVRSRLEHDGDAIDLQSHPQPSFQGSIRLFAEELRRRHAEGYRVVVASDTPEEQERLKQLLEDEWERSGTGAIPVTLAAETLHEGFVYAPASVALFTEHELFGRLKRRGTARRLRFRGLSQRDLTRLNKGDIVVHREFGIGKFAGLQTIKVGSGEQEVMKILYEGNDAIYVNLNFLNRVQKYSSREGHLPRLSKLGTPQWDRLKERARKRVKDIARDLIKLYARRKHEPGFAFSPDSHWQREMEASFMYEDTPDQARATQEVKADMVQEAPMDRLICGDVGFGKTEIAVRAAFKAVLDGKQVAVLVPTTILAQQHALTFRDRLQRYTVRIEHLTRFKSKKEQGEILAKLRSGEVDVVIGTHRLLSRDVQFKDLGLLIVDEEHRFGVSAKEKLRALRASVDTLTMTATPIPRTLQFSLLGARDLSIINTPPRNRLPIITEIAQFDVKLIREAILKELYRGGQVYLIHDRIQTMDGILELLRKHVPEARVHAAHGQMKGHELERTMLEFLDGRYDVLVCTKIIESGIDIPSVNTIIVNRADRFGLAELYQLRGRVGRSNVQAYAYLLTPPLTSLPRESLRRLQAIQEFTELGSGFNLAMRDMEIRGAGNLLGAEQSGFILEMGFDLYQKIVEEAVGELKEEEFSDLVVSRGRERTVEAAVEADVEALIPEVYVSSDSERLDLYRRLYQIDDPAGVEEMGKEMEDRFGEFDVEVDHLLQTIRVKLACEELGFPRLQLARRVCTIWMPPGDATFYEERDGAPSRFQALTQSVLQWKDHHPRFRQDGNQLKLVLRLPEAVSSDQRLSHIRGLLDHMKELP